MPSSSIPWDPEEILAQVMVEQEKYPVDLWPLPPEEIAVIATEPISTIHQIRGLGLAEANDRVIRAVTRHLRIVANVMALCLPRLASTSGEQQDTDAKEFSCKIQEMCGLLTGHKKLVAHSRATRAISCRRRGNGWSDAVALLESAAEVYEAAGASDEAYETRKTLIAVLRQSGRPIEALRATMRFVKLAKARGLRGQAGGLMLIALELVEQAGNKEMAGLIQSELGQVLSSIESEMGERDRLFGQILLDLSQANDAKAVRRIFTSHAGQISKDLVTRIVNQYVLFGCGQPDNVTLFCKLAEEALSDKTIMLELGLALGRRVRADGLLAQARDSYAKVATDATNLGDWVIAGKAWTYVGGVLYDLEEPRAAIEAFRKALISGEKVGDIKERAYILGKSNMRIGRAYVKLGEYSTAIPFFEEAWRTGEPANDSELMVDIATFASECHTKQCCYQKAIEYAERVLTLCASEKDKKTNIIAATLNDIGLNMMRQGRLDEAKGKFHEAEQMASSAGAVVTQADVSGNLGIVACQEKRYRESASLQEECLRLNSRITSPIGIAQAFANRAAAEERDGLLLRAKADICGICFGVSQ